MSNQRTNKGVNLLSTGTNDAPVLQVLVDLDFVVVRDDGGLEPTLNIAEALQQVVWDKVASSPEFAVAPGAYTVRGCFTVVGKADALQDPEGE